MLESAKPRLLYTLDDLGLTVGSRDENPSKCLQFAFLEDTPSKAVLTGHASGLITVNVAEADDEHREQTRLAMREPHRTLLGHFRHEIGHYFYDRLIVGTPLLTQFRLIFGDERADYGPALAIHYREGAVRGGWQDSFISAYAAVHPWEDWAETWAHYLRIVDTIDTATAYGLSIAQGTARGHDARGPQPQSVERGDDDCQCSMTKWFALTAAVNTPQS
ncbi:putative zinc-binding metallopeptidase [Paraburkholderia sp. HD33-4]|uniref:putative zinc-binding metallopeptidase n=1 Tax=Paraburkholderia sp. HD33-4 TaxID=2883242 RepID=UPI002DD42F12|nr:putative zinc-binding metallopeptidase [Paraburkholderia sp. HD33-4]